MKLTITSQWGIRINLLESILNNTAKQNNKLINIANCPNTTRVPVTNGKGIILSSTLFFLLLNSKYPRIINATKLTLQINAILENNFINKPVCRLPFTVF